MIVKTITEDEAKPIIFDDEIISRTSIDGQGEIVFPEARYIGGFNDSRLFGIVIYYDKGEFETCHINVLRKYRRKFSLGFGKNALMFRQGKPLLTAIPDIFKDVFMFAKRLGFQKSYSYRSKLFKNGKQLNMNVLRLD